MPDWTTKKISDDIEIDLHPDLDCFPAVLRRTSTNDHVVLNKVEAKELYQILKAAFGRATS